ncbi:MAG: hypothetical protein ACTSWG_13280 [Candidatus Helarchaeota archaeon]
MKNRSPKGFNKKDFCSWYKHWKAGRQRCNNKNASNYKYYGGKGIKFLLTQEECKKLYFEACAWIFKQAQLYRKDHNKDYTYDNCYFSNKTKNVGERNSRISSKTIKQLDLKNNLIKIWSSASKAGSVLKLSCLNINQCARGCIKSCGGYKWEYA